MADKINIKIKEVKTQQDRVALANLYLGYLNSLCKFNSEIERALFEDEGKIMAYQESSRHIDRKDYLIIIDDYVLAGFFMIGEYPNAFSRHDRYIQEFYINPKYQRQGIGKFVVKEFFKNSKDDISFYILVENTKAKKFWDNVMEELNYENRNRLGNIGYVGEDELLEWRYYVKK